VINSLKNNRIVILLIVLLFLFPFIYFTNGYNIGGDDTRLYFISPSLYLEYMTSTSWYTLGNVGGENSIYHIIPMFYLLSFLENFGDYIFVNSCIYGLLFSLSFLFMYLLIRVLKIDYYISIMIAVLYALSPIMMFGYIQPLFSIFLVVYAPLVFYLLYISVVKNKLIYSIAISFVNVLFLLSIFSFPFFFPILIYFLINIVLILLVQPFDKIYLKILLKNIIIVAVLSIALSLFALMPYLHLLTSDSLFSDITSSSTVNTFKPMVDAVSRGMNILYPMEGLFHYSIQKNFNWQTLHLYDNYYNYLLFINFLFVIFIVLPMFYLKKFSILEKKLYLILFISFLIQLFLFTVNIGIFKDLFYWLGDNAPFFQMFRNFYDKFRLSFVFSDILLLAYSLHIIFKYIYTKKVLYFVLLFLVLLNIYPSISGKYFNQTIHTSHLKTKTVLDKEYLNYSKSIQATISRGERIVSFPLNEAQYSVIENFEHKSAYVGVVLLNYLINIDEYGGMASFRKHGEQLKQAVLNHDNTSIMKILSLYGINYISIDTKFRFNNFQWPFDKRVLNYFENKGYNKLLEHYRLVKSSSNDRFKFYELKTKTPFFDVPANFLLHSEKDFLWESKKVLIDNNNNLDMNNKFLKNNLGEITQYKQISNDKYLLSIKSDNDILFISTKIPFDRDWILISNKKKLNAKLVSINQGFLGFIIDKKLNKLDKEIDLELYFSPRDIFEKYMFYSKGVMYLLLIISFILIIRKKY
jgi:hypothetical protein